MYEKYIVAYIVGVAALILKKTPEMQKIATTNGKINHLSLLRATAYRSYV